MRTLECAQTDLVCAIPTLLSCHSWAMASIVWPFMVAQMVSSQRVRLWRQCGPQKRKGIDEVYFRDSNQQIQLIMCNSLTGGVSNNPEMVSRIPQCRVAVVRCALYTARYHATFTDEFSDARDKLELVEVEVVFSETWPD